MRLNLKNKTIKQVKYTKLLGTFITGDLKWNKNKKMLAKRDTIFKKII